MASSFSLDFKLIFDSLAEPNGSGVRLETLLKHWPLPGGEGEGEGEGGAPPLPSYIRYWKTAAVQNDGLLTWSAFNNGLQESFKNDSQLISSSHTTVTTTQELERALFDHSGTDKTNVINALTRTREEVYRSQKTNMTGSPRKAFLEPIAAGQRAHHRSYSSGQPLTKDMPSEEREKIVLRQLRELLQERTTQDKGGMSSSSQAMINEVLKQLKSILRMSNRVGGSHDQLNMMPESTTAITTNPYATIRRSGSHRSRYPPSHTIDPLGGGAPMVHRCTSLPGSHHTILPMDSEPPPPYSPPNNIPTGSSHAKKSSMSMSNLINIGNPHVTPPPPPPPHNTRQALEMWKQAQLETAAAQRKEHAKHYRSSPELSQEQQLTKEEFQIAQMYGTITRRPSKKSSSHYQHQVKTTSNTSTSNNGRNNTSLPPSVSTTQHHTNTTYRK